MVPIEINQTSIKNNLSFIICKFTKDCSVNSFISLFTTYAFTSEVFSFTAFAFQEIKI